MHDLYTLLPEHMRQDARDYIEKGWPPGDFLCLIFCNDFVHAAERADDVNQKHLFQYAVFLSNAPAACWGDKEAVKAWIERGGLNGYS